MPPKKTEDVSVLLERKFDELKTHFIDEFRKQIQEIVKEEFNKVIEKYEKRTTILESNVEMLQEHVKYLKKQNEGFVNSMDDLEQYGRRQCLRMYGIPQEENETAEDVVNKVYNVIKDINCDVSFNLIDRAHRVGKKREDIIVKFCSFRDRTVVYKARKKCKDTQNHKDVKIGLDLTAKRYSLFSDARNLTDKNSKVKFIYPDINCNLRVLPVVGAAVGFNSMDKLSDILSDL